MQKTISIVTPSYNQGQYIEETITSVLSQKGDFSIEYIIADGGSTDQTVSIIKKYAELLASNAYPFHCNGVSFRWWSAPDGGQSDALNKGFALCTGDILAWINSDDYYTPGAFERALALFEADPALVLVYGDANRRNESDNTLALEKRGGGDYRKLTDEDFIHQSSSFFTAEVFRKVGAIDTSLHFTMDYDLWIRIFKEGKTLYVPEVFSVFRLWEGAKTVASHVKARRELKVIHKRYGTKLIEPWLFYNDKTEPLFNAVKKVFPGTFRYAKRVFNFLNNRQRYPGRP